MGERDVEWGKGFCAFLTDSESSMHREVEY